MKSVADIGLADVNAVYNGAGMRFLVRFHKIAQGRFIARRN